MRLLYILYGVAAVGGLAFGAGGLVAYSYIVRDGIPVISPVIGQLWTKLAMLADDATVLYQQAHGRYRWLSASADEYGPRSRWMRLKRGLFGVAYERDPETFGRHVEDFDPSALDEDDLAYGDGGTLALLGHSRGGRQAVARTDDFAVVEDAEDAIFVRVAEWLHEMADSGGMAVVNRAMQEALKEEGGDGPEFDTLQLALLCVAGYVIAFALTAGLAWLMGAL